MQSWLTRTIRRRARSDISTNPQGLDDGGASISGGVYNLMSPNEPRVRFRRKRKLHDPNKKKQRNLSERPGEQISN